MRLGTFFRTALGIAALAAGPVNADLVAYFKFDEAGGALAFDSGGTYYGTLEGSAKFVPGGISGGAVQVAIDGNGLVNFGDVYSFVGHDFTISLWVKTAPGDQSWNMKSSSSWPSFRWSRFFASSCCFTNSSRAFWLCQAVP